MPRILYALKESNPGMVDGNKAIFRRVFQVFRASIDGFKTIILLLVLKALTYMESTRQSC